MERNDGYYWVRIREGNKANELLSTFEDSQEFEVARYVAEKNLFYICGCRVPYLECELNYISQYSIPIPNHF